jgi:hypothetical protein
MATAEKTPDATNEQSRSLSEDEIIRSIEACKTYHEWLEITKLLPADDGGYDIVKALAENRRWSGETPTATDQGSQQ